MYIVVMSRGEYVKTYYIITDYEIIMACTIGAILMFAFGIIFWWNKKSDSNTPNVYVAGKFDTKPIMTNSVDKFGERNSKYEQGQREVDNFLSRQPQVNTDNNLIRQSNFYSNSIGNRDNLRQSSYMSQQQL